MPTTYAHDLFGKMVYHRLSPEIREVIKAHQTTYQIGLHGPDILFYVRPFHRNRFNQMAHRLHREEAIGFFEKGRLLYQQTGDELIPCLLIKQSSLFKESNRFFSVKPMCHLIESISVKWTNIEQNIRSMESNLIGGLMRFYHLSDLRTQPVIYHFSKQIMCICGWHAASFPVRIFLNL